MPEAIEVVVQSTKKRILIGCFGLLEIATAVLLPKITACGPQTWHWVALTFSLVWFHQGAIFLTVGLRGGFPVWSHAFAPSMFRRIYTRMLKPGAVTPAVTYKWVSPRQVRWLQLATVLLAVRLATLVSPSGPVFNPSAWVAGAAVGVLLASILKYLLKR